jgi:acetyl esterase
MIMTGIYRLLFCGAIHSMTRNDREAQKHLKNDPTITLTELPYAEKAKKYQWLNIYRKKGDATLRPLVFDIHGGAWIYGDRFLNGYFAQALVNQGNVVCCPSYPLLFKGTLKAEIQNLAQALSFLLRNASEYGIDASRVVLAGDSAGGHLALLLAAVLQNKKLQDIYEVAPLPVSVAGLVLCNPVPYISSLSLNLGKPKLEAKARKIFFRMMYGKGNDREILKANSSFESFGSVFKSLPPTLITTSIGDKAFFPQTQRLRDDLVRNGHPIEYFCVSDTSYIHVYNVTDPDDAISRQVNQVIGTFLTTIAA